MELFGGRSSEGSGTLVASNFFTVRKLPQSMEFGKITKSFPRIDVLVHARERVDRLFEVVPRKDLESLGRSIIVGRSRGWILSLMVMNGFW